MCLGSFWTALQLLWSCVYVFCGAIQLMTGIFFIVSIPSLHFTCNLVAGLVNIAMGVAGGAIVCFGKLSPRRQEALLYLACSVLVVNLAAAILREWGLYFQDITSLLKDHPHQLLILYCCFAIRIAAAVVILASFLDSQFAFCSMQIKTKEQRAIAKKHKRTGKRSHDNLADIEYIIPRQKPSKSPSKPHAIYNAYAQSWVFEADQSAASNNLAACTKTIQNGSNSPQKSPGQMNGFSNNTNHHHHHSSTTTTVLKDNNKLLLHVENPVVHIEEASDDSTSNSDRKIGHMRSFSRATSPVLLSAASSQLSLSLNNSSNNNSNNININHQSSSIAATTKPPIYEYLEKLTEPEVYRSRLNSALSDKESEEHSRQKTTIGGGGSNINMRRVESVSPQSEKVQYANFMQELQKAIVNKNNKETISPQSTSGNSKSSSHQEESDTKSSDGDFSRELEAALQLIQDLESPNTAETPSDHAKSLLGDIVAKERKLVANSWRKSSSNGGNSSDDSDKTQTGIGSMGELTSTTSSIQQQPHQELLSSFKPVVTGKGASIIVHHHPNSQSTSGYSSPTHPASSASTTPQNWSTTSSINGSSISNNSTTCEIIQPVSYSIHNTKSTTVISLYTPNGTNKKGKSVTLVSITGDNFPVAQTRADDVTDDARLKICGVDDNHRTFNVDHPKTANTTTTTTPVNINNNNINIDKPSHVANGWRSLLRKKRQAPKLCPELEGAIIKSESLAYLSEVELLARHQRNNEIHRRIEERVIQQLGVPRTESKC